MADFSDVENTLVTTVAGIVYPNGTSQPSIVNADVRIFRGWPIPASLDADLAAGKININVSKIRGMERITTRFGIDYQTLSVNSPTLTATVTSGIPYTITIGGTVSVYQTIMVLYNGNSYVYVVQANDTLNTIASNIAALIEGASAIGSVISIPNVQSLIARIGVTGTSIRETKRQEVVFAITVWAPTFSLRDSLCSALDSALSALIRLVLPDGYYAHIRYSGSPSDDMIEKQQVYQRSLHYSVEFATTQTETDYTVTDNINNVSAAQTGNISP